MSEALRAALESCVLADRGAFGRLLGTGPDLLDLLNRLSTKAVTRVEAGAGCATVLTTPKGRIVERLFVHHLGDDGVLLVAGPGGGKRTLDHLARYTFAENTGLSDVGDAWSHLSLIGPGAGRTLEDAGLPRPGPLRAAATEGVWVLGEDGLSVEGFSIAGPREREEAIRRRLRVPEVDDRVAEAWRILRGLPVAGHELTEDHNPLEAGLWDAVDFDKGCYVGQEVVARLNTYDKVSRVLVGFRCPVLPQRGAAMLDGDRRVGVVTSALVPPGHRDTVGLAYVKKEHAASGSRLRPEGAGGAEATIQALPFAPSAR